MMDMRDLEAAVLRQPNWIDLKSLGVNFIGTFITPLETWATGVGRYDQNIAGRLDELLANA